MSKLRKSDWFESGVEEGWIGTYELEVVRFLEKEYVSLSNEIRLCLVFLSLFIKAGHTSLPLDKSVHEWIQILNMDMSQFLDVSDVNVEISELKSSPIVGSEGDLKPIIVSGERLTFRRYWYYENIVGQWIKDKVSNNYWIDIDRISVEELDNLYYKTEENVNWQKVASALSLLKPFLIISGGPGTGKTTTVARILLLHQRLSEGKLNIALAAPTGKAAGRMGEALSGELKKMGLGQQELGQFPKEAKTVHRLLSGTESSGLLPPVQKELLRHDLIIIDEASMMDLTLMYRLISHLSERTRLILLGDKDQLASVEAGAVFADLCQKSENSFLPDTIEQLKSLGIDSGLPKHTETGINDSIVYLTKSYRFDSESGIGQLSEAVRNKNHEDKSIKTLFDSYSDLKYQPFNYGREDIEYLINDLSEKIRRCSTLVTSEDLLSYWKKSIWLMVHRRGITGTERMNRLIEEHLASQRLIRMVEGWYHGRAIIVTQNDYNLGIYNGDLGVAVRDDDQNLWIYIETGSEVKRFKPQRLVHYEPAFFLTVHKSQGSEFDQVHLLLPQTDSLILNRELIYTAITRTRKQFILHGDLELFEKGIRRESQRYTGLKEILKSR